MPRILLVGSREPLLHVLANIFTARGGITCVSTSADHARMIAAEFAPQLVLWDSNPGDGTLDPSEWGYSGPTIVLAHRILGAGLEPQPQRTVLVKPVSTDELLEATLHLAG